LEFIKIASVKDLIIKVLSRLALLD